MSFQRGQLALVAVSIYCYLSLTILNILLLHTMETIFQNNVGRASKLCSSLMQYPKDRNATY